MISKVINVRKQFTSLQARKKSGKQLLEFSHNLENIFGGNRMDNFVTCVQQLHTRDSKKEYLCTDTKQFHKI